jgi:hypothetical protein
LPGRVGGVCVRRSILLTASLLLALAACGPKAEREARKLKSAPVPAVATGPILSGVGTVAELKGKTIIIDHDAVAGGLPAGRHEFRVYADALAEAPGHPGARIAFTYRAWTPLPVILELKGRE